jgi:hypothetical protein
MKIQNYHRAKRYDFHRGDVHRCCHCGKLAEFRLSSPFRRIPCRYYCLDHLGKLPELLRPENREPTTREESFKRRTV